MKNSLLRDNFQKEIDLDKFFAFSLIFLIISIFLPVKPLSNNFENLHIISERSISFFATIFIIIVGSLKKRIFYLQTSKRLIQLFILNFSYSVLVELLIHKYNIINIYYIAYFLNITLLISLIRMIYQNKRLILICINSYILCTFICSLNIIYQFINLESRLSRLSFMSWNENEIAIAICMGISFIIYKIMNESFNKKQYIFYSIISAFNALAILFTGTRSAILTLFIISILTIVNLLKENKFSLSKQNNYFMKRLLFLSNIIFLSSLIIVLNNFFLKIDIIRSSGILILGGRLNIWKEALNSIFESPLFGKGFVSLNNHIISPGRLLGLPHNYFIENFYIAGLFSFFLSLIIGSLLIIKCKSNNSFNLNNIILILPIFIAANFLNISQFRLIWFCLAIFISLIDLNQKKMTLYSNELK